jgi:hypothetical protein
VKIGDIADIDHAEIEPGKPGIPSISRLIKSIEGE